MYLWKSLLNRHKQGAKGGCSTLGRERKQGHWAEETISQRFQSPDWHIQPLFPEKAVCFQLLWCSACAGRCRTHVGPTVVKERRFCWLPSPASLFWWNELILLLKKAWDWGRTWGREGGREGGTGLFFMLPCLSCSITKHGANTWPAMWIKDIHFQKRSWDETNLWWRDTQTEVKSTCTDKHLRAAKPVACIQGRHSSTMSPSQMWELELHETPHLKCQ